MGCSCTRMVISFKGILKEVELTASENLRILMEN